MDKNISVMPSLVKVLLKFIGNFRIHAKKVGDYRNDVQ